MQSQRPTVHPNHPQRLKTHLCLATLVIQFMSSASAQTVYRCGDQYTAIAQCSKAVTPQLQDTRNTAQEKAQHTQTLQIQKEADALEKNRVNAERQAAQALTRMPAFPQDNALAQSKVTPELPTSNTRGKRHVDSPYFTAKDGSVPKKTKKKTPTNKASAATAP